MQQWRHHCCGEHFLLPWPTLPWVQQQALVTSFVLGSCLLAISAGASSSSSGCDSPGKGGHRGQGQTVLLQEDVHRQAQLARADCGAVGAVCIVPWSARCPGSSLPCLPCREPVSSLERCSRREMGPEGRDAAAREHWGGQEIWSLAGLCVLVRSSTAATLPGDVPLGSPQGLTQGLAACRHGCTSSALLLPQMAVLEIQTNGDTRVSEEAIVRARHSVDDPNMRVSAAG